MSKQGWKETLEQIKELSGSHQRKLFRQLKKLVKKGGKKRKANPALLRELKCSKELQDVIGKSKVSRGKCMKYIWAYIKKHKLQNKDNGQIIEPDKKLAKILGKKPIKMTQLGGKITDHLTAIK